MQENEEGKAAEGGHEDARFGEAAARMERCELHSPRFGLDLWYDASEVHLSRVRVVKIGSVICK